MKKILVFGLAICFSGVLWAATLNIPGNSPISVLTLTQVAASTPTYVGQVVVCSNCASVNGALGTLCISTATVSQNGYIIAGSSLTATTACK